MENEVQRLSNLVHEIEEEEEKTQQNQEIPKIARDLTLNLKALISDSGDDVNQLIAESEDEVNQMLKSYEEMLQNKHQETITLRKMCEGLQELSVYSKQEQQEMEQENHELKQEIFRLKQKVQQLEAENEDLRRQMSQNQQHHAHLVSDVLRVPHVPKDGPTEAFRRRFLDPDAHRITYESHGPTTRTQPASGRANSLQPAGRGSTLPRWRG
jgi:hypothetical protein